MTGDWRLMTDDWRLFVEIASAGPSARGYLILRIPFVRTIMNLKDHIPTDVIKLRKSAEMPNEFDVALERIPELAEYDSLECHIVLYPYSRKIKSSHFSFIPYEEYVKDVLSRQRSAYVPIVNYFNEVFGILIGILIAIIFAVFKPNDLFSVQSVVSIFGAYFIGKELWDDIERILMDISKDWRIRYTETYYSYRLEKFTTLTHYSCFAKRHRYDKETLIPDKIDFISQSDSKTVRMSYSLKDSCSPEKTELHLLSINLNPEHLEDFEKSGYMFGVKLSFNKKALLGHKCFELFQSVSDGAKGCLDENGKWVDDRIFIRKTFVLGRLKFFRKNGHVEGSMIAL